MSNENSYCFVQPSSSLPCGISSDYEVLSKRLLTLGYSNEELQCWHLSVALNSRPLHATVDLLRSRFLYNLDHKCTGDTLSANLCVSTEADVLFKSLRAKELKDMSNSSNKLGSPISVGENSKDIHAEQQPGILPAGCRSFLSG